MGTVVMYDDINVDTLPAGAGAYAGYSNGSWPNVAAVRAKFPGVPVLSIDVAAHYAASDVLDVETGDATNPEAVAWWRARNGHTSTPKPVIYTSASNAAALIQTMTNAGIGRDSYFLWTAHYSYIEHICGSCGYPQADATQWTDKANGQSLDRSLVNDYIFATQEADMPLTQTDVAAILSGQFEINGEWISLVEAFKRSLINDAAFVADFAALKAQVAALPASSGATLTDADVQNIANAVVKLHGSKLEA